MKKIIIFCALLVPSLSAPSGCTESCRTYSNYNSQQQTADLQNLAQQATVALDSSQLNFDSSRPGNWSEQDQYKTDGGHGQVYEERGQYVQGPKRVRFFKKNYTSSYSTGRVGGLESMNLGIANNNGGYDASQLSQTTAERSSNLFDQSSNLEANNYGSAFPIIHGHQSSTRVRSQSERLEDFGELTGNTQVSQHGISGFDSQTAQGQDIQNTYGHSQLDASLPGNWSKVDSYRTDGGNGRVYEEQGQVVDGPRRIRYYRKNYTSSYTNTGMPNINLGMTNLDRDIQQFGKQYDSFGREIHQVSSSNILSANQDLQSTGTTYGNNEYRTGSVRVANNDLINSNSQGLSQGTLDIGAPSTSYTQRTTGTRYRQVSGTRDETATSNSDGNSYVSNQQGSQRIYLQATPRPVTLGQSGHQQVASSESYSSGTQQSYQNSYGSEDQQISQTANHWPNRGGQVHDHVPIGSSHGQYGDRTSQDILQSQVDQTQHSQVSSSQQSGYTQGQISSVNHDQGGYIQNFGQTSGTRPGQIRHYQEYSSSSSHHTGGYVPDIGTGNMQVEDSQQTQQVTQQHSGRIESSNQQTSYDILHGQNTNVGEANQNYNYAYATRPGKLITGILDLGHISKGADCTQASGTTGQVSYGSQYRRMYKRGAAYPEGQNLRQQSNKFDDFTQENEGLTQQNEDLTQQEASGIEFGQQTQQTSEPDQFQVGNKHVEDLTQQNEDFVQQSSKIELGPQQSTKPGKLQVENQQVGDLIPSIEDFTQQTSGKIELGQQQSSIPGQLEIENQETDDLTQQTDGFDDFTQQTSGKIEFGQQTQQSQKPGKLQVENEDIDDLTQQTAELDDFTQQTSGKIEFGQQTQQSQKPEKLQVENEDIDDLTQQTAGLDDFTQQTSGKIEFGQQMQQSQKPGKLQVENEDIDDLMQQTAGLDDFTQQTSGKIEFGQQTQQSQKPGKLQVENEDIDDLTQQTAGLGDFTQQTSGKIEFGQQTQQSQKPGKLQVENEDIDDLTQQTAGLDDFTQQTSGKIELGQQTQQSQKPGKLQVENEDIDDLTQQTAGLDDFTQQTSGKIEFGQQTQQSQKPGKLQVENEDIDDLTQQTAGLDDFTQQTSGKIEFGQIERQSSSWRPGPLQVGNQEVETLTQQTGDIDDFIQQTSGKIETDQQSQSSRNPGNFNADGQGNDDLVQQTGGFGDLTQQISGNFEFGQETQDFWNVGEPQVGNQQAEDLTQQNEDLTQKTSGFEDFIQSPSEIFSNTKKTEQFGLNQQVNEQLPAPKPKLKRKHPNPSQINYAQQGELYQETTGVLQSPQKRDQFNHAQQSNVQWETSHSVQQSAKETVHDQENVNNDNVTPPEVDLEVDDNIRTGNAIRRGDQSQVYYRESANKPSEVEKPQSNSNVPQQGTVIIQQTGHRPDFIIEHHNGYGERQSGSEWHYTHNVADLTNSEGVRSHSHPSSDVPSTASSSNGQTNYVQFAQSQESLGNQQQFPQSNIDLDFGQQQNTEDFQQQSSQLNFDQNSEDQKDFNDFQQQTSHITFDSHPQYPQHSSNHQQQSSQLDFNQNFDDHKDVDDFQQQSSQSIYKSGAHHQISKNFENRVTSVSINNVSQNKLNAEQLHQQYSQNNFGQQAPEILDFTQQNNNNFQTFEKDKEKVGSQQHADNIELDHQQFQYGQEDTDNLQQQSSRFETERDVDQTSQIEQSTMQKGEDVKIEPRLLEAYGGGSFDSVPSRDTYNNVRRNPSATLPPSTSGTDSWIIREKPKVTTTVRTTTEETTTKAPETTTNVPSTTEAAVTTQASIWRRFGNKITNTYDKFRGSARVIFG